MSHSESESKAPRQQLTSREISEVWDAAANFDDSLRIRSKQINLIGSKRILPAPYSRTQMFESMLSSEPALFSGFRIRHRFNQAGLSDVPHLVETIRSGLPRSKRARVRTKSVMEYLPVGRVLDRWERAKAVLGVTDLHYIGTRLDALVDTDYLNDFNLLERGTDSFQSQDSLVISSEGAVTDSHSDDHSGSNHSFIGTKLWLLWDTLEGFDFGLEDVERCDVYERAAFELSAFLAMRSSRWILIGPGQTMFIPAHLTHKVITLKRYLGLGSFHAALPGFLNSLLRWTALPPLWTSKHSSNGSCSVEHITQRAIRRIKYLRSGTEIKQIQWGVPYLRRRLQSPDLKAPGIRAIIMEDILI